METSAADQHDALPRHSWSAATVISPAPDSDDVVVDALLRAAGQGDSGAFGAFYDQTAPAVFGLLCGVLGEQMPAEQATERVYLRLWRSAPRFNPTNGSARCVLLRAACRELVCRPRVIVDATAVSDLGTGPALSERR